MKTQKNYDEYLNFVEKQNSEIETLETELVEVKKSHEKAREDYKLSAKKGDEVEANKQYELRVKLTDDIKKLEQRISIKKDIIKATQIEKIKEVLVNAKDLKRHYDDDLEKAHQEIDKASEQYNNAMKMLHDTVDSFNSEQNVYRTILENLDQQTRKEVITDTGISFSEFRNTIPRYSPYTLLPIGLLSNMKEKGIK